MIRNLSAEFETEPSSYGKTVFQSQMSVQLRLLNGTWFGVNVITLPIFTLENGLKYGAVTKEEKCP